MKRFLTVCGLLLGAAALAVLLYHVIPVRILTEHEREQVASIEVVCWGVEERLTLTDPEEIDRIRAQEALERAKERLRQKQSISEYYSTRAAMARALVRLKETEKFVD